MSVSDDLDKIDLILKLDQTEERLKKAVIMIRELVLASAWHGSVLNQQAEALLEEIDDLGRQNPGGSGAVSVRTDDPAA